MIKSLIYNCQGNNLFIDIGDNIKIIYNNKIYYVKYHYLLNFYTTNAIIKKRKNLRRNYNEKR